MDCEQLSPNARRIFGKITELYPPDPWDNPQHKEDGRVFDHGWHDLKKAADRQKLIDRYFNSIGIIVVVSAEGQKKRKGDYDDMFTLRLCRRSIDLVILLNELDFQIETLDLVES